MLLRFDVLMKPFAKIKSKHSKVSSFISIRGDNLLLATKMKNSRIMALNGENEILTLPVIITNYRFALTVVACAS
jgi:hypothetical protein